MVSGCDSSFHSSIDLFYKNILHCLLTASLLLSKSFFIVLLVNVMIFMYLAEIHLSVKSMQPEMPIATGLVVTNLNVVFRLSS